MDAEARAAGAAKASPEGRHGHDIQKLASFDVGPELQRADSQARADHGERDLHTCQTAGLAHRRQPSQAGAATRDGPQESHALSFDQSFSALASVKSPAREMVLFAILTSMNIAEICGL